MFKKTISLFLSFSMLFTQPLFAQGIAELNMGKYLSQMPALNTDKFRPLHLRYLSYDSQANDFKLLLDKGDTKFDTRAANELNSPGADEFNTAAQELLNYFFVGLALPNEKFWVNLRPDAPEQIIDPELERTDIGKILLEADLQLKKDTTSFTSPQTPEGKEYWDKLYKRAGELFGTENITIPTITRPWIVPGEVIIRETENSAYVYKANLKVMLEEDYLKSQVAGNTSQVNLEQYTFEDSRLKELNQYSTQLIRELILPKLTKEVNSAKRYAKLRQVFFSLILSRWFKDRFGKPVNGLASEPVGTPANPYIQLIDSHNLTNLTSQDPWNKDYYFNEYKKSFEQGEYNLKEQVVGLYGQSVKSYVSGGILPVPKAGDMNSFKAASPIFTNMQKYALAGLVGLAVGYGAVVVGQKFGGYLSQPTEIRETQKSLNAIDENHLYTVIKIMEDFLNDMIEVVKKSPDEGMGLARVMLDADVQWMRLLRHALAILNSEERDKFFEVLNIIIESLRKELNEDDEKIGSFLNQVQKLLKKAKAASSPLTKKGANKVVNEHLDNLDRNYGDNSSADGRIKTYWAEISPEYRFYVNYIVNDKQDLRVMETKINKLERMVKTIKDTVGPVEFVTDLNKLLDSIKVWIDVTEKEFNLREEETSSSLAQDLPQTSDSPLMPGGIDFRKIDYLTQPMGSFQGLDLRLPLLSQSELEAIDIQEELADIGRLVNSRLDPSSDRIKRLLAAMHQKGIDDEKTQGALFALLTDICRLKEEENLETSKDFRAVLLIADTGLYVEQGETRYSMN